MLYVPGEDVIVHTTKSRASNRTSILMLFALLLLPPGALLLTLHLYCKLSGGRASRFFFPPTKADPDQPSRKR